MYLWLRGHPVLVDALVAVGIYAVLVVFGSPVLVDPYGWSSFLGGAAEPSVPDGLRLAFTKFGAPVISACLVLPLALRRLRPEWCAGVIAAVSLLQWAFGLPIYLSQIGVLVALHGVAAYGPRWASRAALALGLLGAGLAATRYFEATENMVVVGGYIVALVLAAWALGDLQRVRRQQMEGLRERARRLEVEREQESRLAAADERARIARELHDVVAHSLSVVIAQADGGRYAAEHDPQAAVEACETVSETGRGALTEMRRLLGVLRTDDGASRAPTPGVADIDDLVASVRNNGLEVEFSTTGTPESLSSGVELAAYRIVQEALTNVLKHAGPEVSVDVRVDWTPEGLMVAVVDDGRGAAADAALRPEADGSGHGAGHGITGMSERATLYGGWLQAGPVPGGGFAVRARLPYPSAEKK
ncbi:sensor histidine kinase [Actinobacteria bacterium YIM 96077]|uniref:histidine kinase n=2 Tax=Phytoactinopolyspora halophila TaxID=1981511 RepID=A0A329R0C7_9ACTN|nr:sensor histidine kinase [Actinobacteria bacterium YIM 96077]RAW18080.1 sensor histidine kinase [Phytoactinopolyspora halophila]